MTRGLITIGMGLLAATATLAQRGPGRGPATRIQIGRPRLASPRTPVDKWNQMTPQEREKALKKLPPERQKAIREGIQHFNQLPSDEQQRLRERYQSFSHLPPEKQDQVRRQIRRLNDTAPERRKVLTQEMNQLRRMPADERKARLSSDEFRSSYSEEERQMIQDLSENFRELED